MKVAFLVVLVIHGAIHIMGFTKSRAPGRVEQITKPVGALAGWLWLLASLLWLVSAGVLGLTPKHFGLVAIAALTLSQGLIVAWWKDARFGTVVNLTALLPAVVSIQNVRSNSFDSRYCRDAAAALEKTAPPTVVSVTELAGLPVPLRNYLMRAGVVGHPRVRNFRAHFSARMRRNPKAGWMSANVDQVESYPDYSRLFLMRSSLFGIPFDGYHRFVGDAATMQIRVLSSFDVANASGKLMTAGETVTLFNDMCLLAPATLLDPKIEWSQTGENSVHATWTHYGNTVRAELIFDASGDLVNFISNDRYLSEDGKTYTQYPWSTPILSYKVDHGRRVPAVADAVWRMPSGNFTYAHFEVQSIEYNVDGPALPSCN